MYTRRRKRWVANELLLSVTFRFRDIGYKHRRHTQMDILTLRPWTLTFQRYTFPVCDTSWRLYCQQSGSVIHPFIDWPDRHGSLLTFWRFTNRIIIIIILLGLLSCDFDRWPPELRMPRSVLRHVPVKSTPNCLVISSTHLGWFW